LYLLQMGIVFGDWLHNASTKIACFVRLNLYLHKTCPRTRLEVPPPGGLPI